MKKDVKCFNILIFTVSFAKWGFVYFYFHNKSKIICCFLNTLISLLNGAAGFGSIQVLAISRNIQLIPNKCYHKNDSYDQV